MKRLPIRYLEFILSFKLPKTKGVIKIFQKYEKIVNLVEIGALNRAGASDRLFDGRARKRGGRHICRYRKYPPKNLDLRIGPAIFAEKNMIRNFNIQAWWWRSLTLVDNECGSVRV